MTVSMNSATLANVLAFPQRPSTPEQALADLTSRRSLAVEVAREIVADPDGRPADLVCFARLLLDVKEGRA